jgi:hypothetical protein
MDDSDLEWPACGWAPVFRTDGRRPTSGDLVGFTTFTLPNGVRSFRFSAPQLPRWGAIDGREVEHPGAFIIGGLARVINAGGYLAWLLIDEDPAGLPEYWQL